MFTCTFCSLVKMIITLHWSVMESVFIVLTQDLPYFPGGNVQCFCYISYTLCRILFEQCKYAFIDIDIMSHHYAILAPYGLYYRSHVSADKCFETGRQSSIRKSFLINSLRCTSDSIGAAVCHQIVGTYSSLEYVAITKTK